MLVLVAVLLVMIPAVAILYPFVRGPGAAPVFEDEGTTSAELSRRWEAALAGLRNTELERTIGNLAEDDYRSLREQYMTDAALVMKAMELEDQEEEELLAGVEQEVQRVRQSLMGGDGSQPESEGAG